MKRKTLTLPREFFEKVNNLTEQTKHEVIDAIFDLFFNEKQIQYENFNEMTRTALACLVPDLRRIQTQFDNGKIEKKSNASSQGFFCPSEDSQFQPNPANSSQADSSIFNNNIYNKNNIYNNNQIISNQSKNKTTPDTVVQISEQEKIKSNPEKRKAYAQMIINQINLLQNDDRAGVPEVCLLDRLSRLVQKISDRENYYEIRKEKLLPEEILVEILNIFRTSNPFEVFEHIQSVFARIDNIDSTKINNIHNYTVAAFYLMSKNL